MSAHSSKGGLKWVRDELLANLDKIGVQVGEGADVGDTITLLFEMRAVLMALPFPAAAMLAEEMQRTCEQMTKEATLDAEQARQSVLLAGVQLGDYLRRKDSAARRDPLELLGNINDLRHSRGVPPISAAELLVPASVLRQGDQLPAESLDSLVRLALRVRPHFHRYLVRWFSGENAHEGLLGLSRLFSDMRRYFKQGPVHELFLAAEAVIGALLDGHLEADAPTKALIGRIDKVLKPLTASAPAWPADLATALIGDLLARIAHMPASSPAVQQLEDVLGHRLIESETIDSLPRSTENDTAPMLAGLRRELNDIAVSLEKLSDGALDRGELAAGPRRLARLAESLGALNQEAAALRISRCAEALDLELRASVPDEGRVGDVVRTLRQVDEELEAFADLTEFASDAAHGRRLPRADEATAETLVEARQVLSRARDVVAGGPLNTPGLDQLDDIHQSLQALSDDVRGVGEREPARLLETLAAQLRTRYLEQKQLPGEAGLELLARAMAAVDIYLEDRLERDVADVRMIAEADYAIERLASLLRSDDEIEGDSEASDSLPWSEVSQSVNLEFLNLFFDEAQEELESLRISYERWSQDRSDDVALSSFKRSFQTLKNSGSLVGARHLADLSRSVVSVLERLFDRELMPDLPVTDFLSDVVATMPDIIECESQGREAPTAQLMRAARALLTDRAGQGGKVIPLTVNRDARPAEPSGSEAAASTRPPPLQSEAAETAGGAVDGSGVGADQATSEDSDPDANLEALLEGDDLVAVFVEEALQLLDALEPQVSEWTRRPPSAASLALARRRLHTLKGSGRMAGFAPIGDLAHAMESLLAGAERMPASALGHLPGLAQRTLDTLSAQVAAARDGEAVQLAGPLLAEIAALPLAGEEDSGAAAVEQGHEVTASAAGDADDAVSPDRATQSEMATTLRVDADRLDSIINASGEVGVYRARLLQQNARLGFRLAQLEDNVKRAARRVDTVSDQVRERRGADDAPAATDGDSLRTLREAAALLGEARSLTSTIGEMQRDNADLLRQQMRVAESLQDDLLRVRMLPVDHIEARLARLVRFVADGLAKKAELVLRGGDVQVDRRVLERFAAPLEHLLRNAVVHGIESPELRRKRHKPEIGRITVDVTREGNDVVLDVADDGAGMDLTKLRERAVALGLLAPEAEPSPPDLFSLALRAGFSTASEVTQEAGRGVGLDVVNSEVVSLNGELNLSSKAGRGTHFRIRLPLTLSIVEALLVSTAETLLAVPHGTALAVARVERERLEAGDAVVEYRGEQFPVEPIARALNPSAVASPPRRRWLPVLLVEAGTERVAFQVDSLHETQRVLVKPIGPPLASLRWLSGGSVLPDGRVALLADLPALLRGLRRDTDEDQSDQRRPTVLVVDDSETVRRVAVRLLGRENMDVVTARDGIDAQLTLRSRQPDLLIVDLDMPRMNGLELTRWVRNSDDLRRLPVIMVTSMGGKTKRKEALAAGVDRFITKPFAEDELLAQIEGLLHPIDA